MGFTFDGDDELRNHGENSRPALGEKILGSLNCEELPGMLRFAKTIKEQRKVMVVVKLIQVNLARSETIMNYSTFQEILFPLVSWSRAMGKSPRS
jgi:hypothetical protein